MVETPATQLFTGTRLAADGEHSECTCCTRLLREGEQLTVYAAQAERNGEWQIDRLYCRECMPIEITTPTLGVTELLVRGRIGRLMDISVQSGCQVLIDVQPVALSSPAQGAAEADTDQPTALLLATPTAYETVYHIDNGEGVPVCNTQGSYISMSVAEAEAHDARRCQNCEAIQSNHQHTRTCPHCQRQIGTSAWPQHIRSCPENTGKNDTPEFD